MNPMKNSCLVYTEFLNHEAGIGQDMRQVMQGLEMIGTKLIYEVKTSNKITRICELIWSLMFGPKILADTDFAFAPHVRPQVYSIPHLVRVHDVFPISNPEWFKWSSKIYFKLSLKTHSKTYYIFDSNTSKEAFLKYVRKLDPTSFSVMHCNLRELSDETFCKVCVACVERENLLTKSFAIAVGTIEPRKNYNYLLNNWEKTLAGKSQELLLYVIGSYGWKSRSVRRKLLKDNNQILWLGKICDASLKTMYSSAKLFVSASKAEGFNLPVKEALSFGLPVVISDIPVHCELYSEEAIFFTLDSVESFHKAIEKALELRKTNFNMQRISHVNFSDSNLILKKAIERVISL